MKLKIIDDLPPETLAMLQSLYSRSPKSVDEHLETVRIKGADKFMATFYVGYGHKSIGDCGNTALFIEGVSMLAAKAIQDSPLYSGQEASTRYMDMAKAECVNPSGLKAASDVQHDWMDLYAKALESLILQLKAEHPGEGVIWEKTIKARAFDIARSLIPAGCKTNLAWSTNLRQAWDHVKNLSAHPLVEVSCMGIALLDELKARYPSSFGHEVSDAQRNYLIESMARFAFHFEPDCEVFSVTDHLDHKGLNQEMLHRTRPHKSELHHRFRRFGSATFKFSLDFGSYRDLQRQRSAVQEMPLLTLNMGFHPWYASHLPERIMAGVHEMRERTARLLIKPYDLQYCIPMGFTVPVVMVCNLPSAVYIAELRSGQTVHPTLRSVAQSIGDWLADNVSGLAMHHDREPDQWSLKRGTQDIVSKTS